MAETQIEFVGTQLCSERFFSGYSGFPLIDLQYPQLVEHSCSARTIWDLNKVIIIIEDVDSIFFFLLFCIFRNSICDRLFNVAIIGLENNNENLNLSSWIFFRWLSFFSTEIIEGQISTQTGLIAW